MLTSRSPGGHIGRRGPGRLSAALLAAAALAGGVGCGGHAPDDTAAGNGIAVTGGARLGPVLLEDFSAQQIFPPDNWWNLEVATAPVDPGSAAYIAFIGPAKQCHPDFGPPPYGIPYAEWHRVGGGKRSDLAPGQQPPPAGRMDLGRRRGVGDLPGIGAV